MGSGLDLIVAGIGWPEDHKTVHWLENRGTETAVEISIDIVRKAP